MNEHANLTFEQALSRLEEIVEQLDAGELPLEESLKLFEEGMSLKALCMERLSQAETKVAMYAAEEELDQLEE